MAELVGVVIKFGIRDREHVAIWAVINDRRTVAEVLSVSI